MRNEHSRANENLIAKSLGAPEQGAGERTTVWFNKDTEASIKAWESRHRETKALMGKADNMAKAPGKHSEQSVADVHQKIRELHRAMKYEVRRDDKFIGRGMASVQNHLDAAMSDPKPGKKFTTDEAWAAYRNLPEEDSMRLRQMASQSLSESMAEMGQAGMHGISSSDINHRSVEMIQRGDFAAKVPSKKGIHDIHIAAQVLHGVAERHKRINRGEIKPQPEEAQEARA